MRNLRRVASLLVAVVVLAGIWYRQRGSEPAAAVDLASRFDQAERRPLGAGSDVMTVTSETIGGTTRRSILAYAPTRISYKLTLPNRGRFRASLGLDRRAWDSDCDGVQFRVAITTPSKGYKPLFARYVDPRHNEADRGWIPVEIDLSAYSGQEVVLILATDVGRPGSADRRNDFAYWGRPAITLR